jgi:hypothetical protein
VDHAFASPFHHSGDGQIHFNRNAALYKWNEKTRRSRRVFHGGTFWLKSELTLTRTPTNEAAPPPLADARRTTEKYSLLFSFCARRISFSLNEKSIFLWCFALTSKAAGLASVLRSDGSAAVRPTNGHPVVTNVPATIAA